MNTYRPLPSNLTIKPSKIEGLGLFATKNIKENTNLGISHVEDKFFSQNLIRTPLGGWINHSNTPNCKLVEDGRFLFLVAAEKIKKGDELTTDYNNSKCGKDYIKNICL